MIAFCELLAALLVLKYSVTGAVIWLRHGYDGFEFVFSHEFPLALMNWKLDRGDGKDIEVAARQIEGADWPRT